MDWQLVAAILLACACIGALVAPRNGREPMAGAGIGLFFTLPGILFLLLVRGSGPTSAERERRRQWDEWQAWQAGWPPPPPSTTNDGAKIAAVIGLAIALALGLDAAIRYL